MGKRRYTGEVFKTTIPQTIRLSGAPGFRQTIFEYSPDIPGALTYRAFTRGCGALPKLTDEYVTLIKSISSRSWKLNQNWKNSSLYLVTLLNL